MKKLSSVVVMALILGFVLTSATNSITKKKKGWKGTITYSISYSGEGITPAMVANAPKSTKVKVMGNKTSAEIVNGPMVLTIIQNPEFNSFYQLIEFGDKKYAVKKSLDEINADSLRKYDTEIDLVNETKIIAGYECKKAVVTFIPRDTADGEEQIFNFYYSTDLGDANTNSDSEFSEIPGLLLEYYNLQGNLITKFVATNVKKGGVKETDFLIPTDYKVLTEEELQKEFSK